MGQRNDSAQRNAGGGGGFGAKKPSRGGFDEK